MRSALHSGSGYPRRQRGAALIIGLMLLLVLTLLAISGMNAATTEFVMAGNEQYHANAFQAAEFGIAQAIATSNFDPDTPDPPFVGAVTGSPNDNFNAVVAYQNKTPGALYYTYSANTVDTYHFEVQSTGTSVRNARAVNAQGVAEIGPKSPVRGCNSAPPCTLQ
jgi:type IV pilus assembly protein PilX